MQGAQRPAVSLIPPYVATTAGDMAIALGRGAGVFLDPWQEYAVRMILAEAEAGRWAAFEAALIVARQNGKNEVLLVLELAAIYLFDELLIVHSAHRFDTSQEHFLRLQTVIEGSDHLLREVQHRGGRTTGFVTANGKEAIKFRQRPGLARAPRILFKARSRGGGRGFSAPRLILDEAYDLPPKAIGAIMPTMTTFRNPQIVYASSPAHHDSQILHSLRKRAKAADPHDGLLYLGWENEPDAVLDDPETLARANPGLGIRVELDFLLKEWRSMRADPETRAEFAREVAGIPEGGEGTSRVLDMAIYAELESSESTAVSDRHIGLAVSQERTWSCFGIVGRNADGKVHVEVIRRAEGTAWVVDYAGELKRAKGLPIRLDPTAQAGAFVRPLTAAGVEVEEVPARAYAQACGRLLDAFVNREARHPVSASLQAAFMGADKSSAKGWTWTRGSAMADITPLEALTCALSGMDEGGAFFAY